MASKKRTLRSSGASFGGCSLGRASGASPQVPDRRRQRQRVLDVLAAALGRQFAGHAANSHGTHCRGRARPGPRRQGAGQRPSPPLEQLAGPGRPARRTSGSRERSATAQFVERRGILGALFVASACLAPVLARFEEPAPACTCSSAEDFISSSQPGNARSRWACSLSKASVGHACFSLLLVAGIEAHRAQPADELHRRSGLRGRRCRPPIAATSGTALRSPRRPPLAAAPAATTTSSAAHRTGHAAAPPTSPAAPRRSARWRTPPQRKCGGSNQMRRGSMSFIGLRHQRLAHRGELAARGKPFVHRRHAHRPAFAALVVADAFHGAAFERTHRGAATSALRCTRRKRSPRRDSSSVSESSST